MVEKRYRKKTHNASLHPEDLELLTNCYTFRTLGEHAEAFIRLKERKPSEKAALVKQLEHFLDLGLFLDEDSFKNDVFRQTEKLGGRNNEKEGITIIGIPTANRPAELERLFGSLIPHLMKYGRRPEIVIADDSDDKNLLSNKKIIENQKNYSGRITHLDKEARKAFAFDIAKKSGTPIEVALFALCGDETFPNQTGALRNSIVLHSAGKKILMMDDDVIIETHQLPASSNRTSNLVITSSYSNGHYYFEDIDSAKKFFPITESNILKDHEEYLGMRTAEVLRRFGPESTSFDPSPGGLTLSLFNNLQKIDNQESKIRTTFYGSIGASWSKYQSLLDTSLGRPHGLSGSSKEEYLRNKGTPFVSRLDGPSLFYGSTCVALNVGIDASNLVPPFPPLYRNQDNVFGLIMNKIFPTSFSFYLPTAIGHWRGDSRYRNAQPFANLGTTAFLTRNVIGAFFANQESGSARMEALGKHLSDLAESSPEKLETLVRYELLTFINNMRTYSKIVRSYYGESPSWWLEDMDALYNKSTTDHVHSLEFFSDVPEWTASGSDPWKHFQSWLKKFGTLITYWPQIFKTAKR